MAVASGHFATRELFSMCFNTMVFLEVQRPILFDWLILVVLFYCAIGLWRNLHAKTATERIARRGAICGLACFVAYALLRIASLLMR